LRESPTLRKCNANNFQTNNLSWPNRFESSFHHTILTPDQIPDITISFQSVNHCLSVFNHFHEQRNRLIQRIFYTVCIGTESCKSTMFMITQRLD